MARTTSPRKSMGKGKASAYGTTRKAAAKPAMHRVNAAATRMANW